MGIEMKPKICPIMNIGVIYVGRSSKGTFPTPFDDEKIKLFPCYKERCELFYKGRCGLINREASKK